MSEITFTAPELDEFGAKLDAVMAQFTPEEQALLNALVNRGIAGVHEDAGEDVSGFLLLPAIQSAREAARRSNASTAVLVVSAAADGSVLPTDQFSMNFTKLV